MTSCINHNLKNRLGNAVRETGCIDRTLFRLDGFRDPALLPQVQAGLNIKVKPVTR